MNEVKGKSIWDDLPEDWQEPRIPAEQPEPVEVPAVTETPAPEVTGGTALPPAQPAGKPSSKAARRLEKEKIQEYVRKNDKNRRDASESTRNAYRAEHRGNRRDFIILGVVLFLAACVIVTLLIGASRLSTERVYTLIEQGNYSTAYQSLSELAEKGENIDQLVYAFCEACVEDSEYKRAVAALEYLSPAAENNTAFFTGLVESLLSHRKVNRARDVLDYLYRHGERLSSLADQLAEKYTELS